MAVGTKRLTGVAVAGVVSAASDALAGAVLDIAASVMAGKWHPRRLLQRIPVKIFYQEANLAAMPWEDFEHLVRQLFEWEFGRHGAEVRLTRTSRDRGVDAIIFDPDPLRGGFGRRPDLRAARPWQRGHAWSHLPYTSPSGGGLWPPSRLPFQLESRPIRL
jgi:hypothetical protein